MRERRLWRRPLAVVVALAVLGLVASAAWARSDSPTRGSASIKACALLPDTKSSTRYTLFDAPYLKAAFRKANVPAQVLNALGDSQKQLSQAQQCLAQGAKVILLDQLNPASGKAITNLAVNRGAKVVDYDRQVVGSKGSYYVSFDNPGVGRLQARGLIAALKAKKLYAKHPVIAELNGDVKDNNAKDFKKGYDSVLKPLYKKGTFKRAKAGDQWTEWNPIKARQIFDQMLARNGNKINGAIAANDGIAGAVIASLKAHGLKKIPVTGQDATPTGVQFILAGWQSGTVYKSVRKEANTAAKVTIQIVKGQKVTGVNKTVNGMPSLILTPLWVTTKNYTFLFKDGALKRSQVCKGIYRKYCK